MRMNGHLKRRRLDDAGLSFFFSSSYLPTVWNIHQNQQVSMFSQVIKNSTETKNRCMEISENKSRTFSFSSEIISEVSLRKSCSCRSMSVIFVWEILLEHVDRQLTRLHQPLLAPFESLQKQQNRTWRRSPGACWTGYNGSRRGTSSTKSLPWRRAHRSREKRGEQLWVPCGSFPAIWGKQKGGSDSHMAKEEDLKRETLAQDQISNTRYMHRSRFIAKCEAKTKPMFPKIRNCCEYSIIFIRRELTTVLREKTWRKMTTRLWNGLSKIDLTPILKEENHRNHFHKLKVSCR